MARRCKEPELGPYMVEIPHDDLGRWDTEHCSVVDTRQPNPDPNREGGKGWVSVFSGTFEECDAWMEARPDA